MDAEIAAQWARNMQATNPDMTSVKVASALADRIDELTAEVAALREERDRWRDRADLFARGYAELEAEVAALREELEVERRSLPRITAREPSPEDAAMIEAWYDRLNGDAIPPTADRKD